MSRVALISDTHDNLDRVRDAVRLFNRLKPDLVVHCGDYVAQFTLAEFAKLETEFRGVLGNCDGDRAALCGRAREFGFQLTSGLDRFVLGGKQFAVSHQPMNPVPDCDFYVHGHTHQSKHESGRPVIVNPGEGCGWLTGHATAALIDTDTGAVQFFDL
jgi:hypothetical protein